MSLDAWYIKTVQEDDMTGKFAPSTLVTVEEVARKSASTGSLEVDRVPAPGGWLYVTTHFSGFGVVVHSTFVPVEAAKPRPEPVVNYEDRH